MLYSRGQRLATALLVVVDIRQAFCGGGGSRYVRGNQPHQAGQQKQADARTAQKQKGLGVHGLAFYALVVIRPQRLRSAGSTIPDRTLWQIAIDRRDDTSLCQNRPIIKPI